ncbi:MAG: FecR family protein, partial [Bryobacteraceae bacterium]
MPWSSLRPTARWTHLAALLVVCAVSLPAQFDGAAQVVTLQGRVDVMRDSTRWVLNAGDTVKPGQLIVTGPDGLAMFRLADGSEFAVYPNSQVTFRDNRGNLRDLLEVWIGKVRVHIQKLSGGKPNFNRVGTPTAIISVRGTVFEVDVEDDGGTTFVMVEEGLVGVQHKLLPDNKEVPLSPGESIRVYRNQPLAARNVNKGVLLKASGRAIVDGLYEIMLGRNRGPSGSGGST